MRPRAALAALVVVLAGVALAGCDRCGDPILRLPSACRATPAPG